MVDVVGSFMKGFQAGQGVVDTINQRERRETLQAREDTQWEQGQQDRKQRLADAQTQRERGETLWQEGREDRKTALSDAEADRARQKTLQGREDLLFKQGQEEYSHQKTLQRRKEGEQMTSDWLNYIHERGGQYVEPSPDLAKHWEENPHLDISNLVTPESVIGRQQARQLMQQMAKGQSIDRKDPRLLNAINQLFPEIVNNPSLPQTYNGKQITGRAISSIDAAPNGGGFMVTQKLTLDDGSQVEVPVTQNRSSDPSDNVVVIPFTTASERLGSLDKIDLSLNDEMKQQLFRSRVIRGLDKAGVKSGDKTGIQKQYLAAIDDINKQEQEALSFAGDDTERQQIAAQYKAMRDRTRDTYNEFLGESGRPSNQTRTDSQKFKSDIKTFENAAGDMGIKWTPEVKADVEELYREGADAETVLRLLQQKYGSDTTSNPKQAQSLVDSIVADLKGSRSGELGETYKEAQSSGLDIQPPTIQPTQTPTGTPEEIAANARLAQASPRPSSYDVSQAPGLNQAYGAQ